MLRWWKKMSRTDAQQPTEGWPVAYLRMTEGGAGSADLDALFAGVPWADGFFGRNPVQEAHVDFAVYDDDQPLGTYALTLTYNQARTESHMHPALWIHWGEALCEHLRQNSREGWFVVVERNEPDAVAPFTLTFQRAQPA
jgi:hypothetical protein